MGGRPWVTIYIPTLKIYGLTPTAMVQRRFQLSEWHRTAALIGILRSLIFMVWSVA